jgi:hypothetical protein
MIKPEKPMLFVTKENTKSNLLGLYQHLKVEHYANEIKSHKSCSSSFHTSKRQPWPWCYKLIAALGSASGHVSWVPRLKYG